MKTLTRKELIENGADFLFTRKGLNAQVHKDFDKCVLNGVVFTHEANDYQHGAGNSPEFALFRAN